MMKALVLTTAGLIGLVSSVSSAMCSDGYVADCGEFKVLSTSCPISNEAGDVIGHSEDFSAVFNDSSQPEVNFKVWPTADPQPVLYRAILNSESDLYLSETSSVATNRKNERSFKTYKIEWGTQSPTKECTPIKD